MRSHAPEGYPCPFCRIAAGVWDEHVRSSPADVVFQDDAVTVLISARQWPNNPGHVLVLPNAHYENLYDLPVELGGRIHAATRDIALVMKAAYGCPGISTRQHNEPAGGQDVWHYHLHVFPRYPEDRLYEGMGSWMSEAERAAYAKRLRAALAAGGSGSPVPGT